jgi:hypothetical protein
MGLGYLIVCNQLELRKRPPLNHQVVTGCTRLFSFQLLREVDCSTMKTGQSYKQNLYDRYCRVNRNLAIFTKT